MADRLFVYGTLAPGQPNEHVLAAVPGTWRRARVTGHLIEHGWGAALGFPALRLDDDGPEVDGLVFESADLAHHWRRLDEFEGDGYERVVVHARLEDGTVVDTCIYVGRWAPGDVDT